MGSTIDDEGHGDVPYSVAAATRASERLELVAGADLLPDKRDAFQSRWGTAVYEDFRDMIDRERARPRGHLHGGLFAQAGQRGPGR